MPPDALRVLVVAAEYFPALGGSEAQTRLLTREFLRRGMGVEIWTRRLDSSQPRVGTLDEISVHRLGAILRGQGLFFRRLERLSFAAALYRALCAERRFDVVFVNQHQYPATIAALASRRTHVPTLARTATSGPISEMRRRGMFFERQRAVLIQHLFGVVALGETTRLECERAGFAPERITVIPNAVRSPSVARAPSENPARMRAIWLGKFRPEKRIDLALSAWHESRVEGILDVVGDGESMKQVAAEALRLSSLEGSNAIEVKGALPDPSIALSRADVFIQSSDAEGMSNALLEAMAEGCACIATDVGETRSVLGGPPGSVIDPGGYLEAEAGLLVRPGDVQGLARALRSMQDVSSRTAYGKAAQMRSAANHSVDRVGERYLELFRSVAARSITSALP